MAERPKEAAQLLNLALSFEGRVSMANSLSKREVVSFNFSYWLGVAVLLQDRPCSSDVVGKFKQLENNVLGSSGSLLDFIGACSSIRAVMTQHGKLERGLIRDLRLRWVGSIMSALESVYGDNPIVHPSRNFDSVATFLAWFKRIPLCIRPSGDAAAEYRENDARISSIQFEENVHVPGLRDIWFEWFSRFKLRYPFHPRHGSGSTADAGRIRAQKWASLRSDNAARVCFTYPSLERCDIPPLDPSIKREAKVVFVPKQAGKDRTICMEPAWLQYLQQGVASQLVAYTHRADHPLALYVDIFSQETNRRLCAEAIWRRLATIDLSNASDSISYRLIKELCKGLPLWKYLYGSRSTSALLEGEVETFDKFAPMGSALCFPIESYLFASIVEYSYRRYYGKAGNGHPSGCSVYGDDIIVPQELYQLVTETLNDLGFVVNDQKSFRSGIYYESCGVEYCNGVRINTVRHPRRHLHLNGEMASPDEIGMVTDLANSLLDFGYFRARRLLLKYYDGVNLRAGNKVGPFGKYLRWGPDHLRSRQETVLQGRWNQKLQRREYTGISLQATPKRSRFDIVELFHNVEPATREERLRRRTTSIRKVECHPKWSERGIISLLKMGHFDLLEDGDVVETGTCRTGRLRYSERTWSSEL